MKQKKQFRILTKLISVILCLCLMFTGCIIGAVFFVRPSTSVLEKRKLTEFPKFTMTTFLNGQFYLVFRYISNARFIDVCISKYEECLWYPPGYNGGRD